MTRRRYDNHSTEFGLWLRQQPDLDSRLGFIATNVDYVWCNYKTGRWMLIEEKRFKARMNKPQEVLFSKLAAVGQNDPLFMGAHLLRFERTSPDDGRMMWNNGLITVEQLKALLRLGE